MNHLLRALVDLRDRQVQKARIQFSNRVSALERATDNGAGSEQRRVAERWLDVFNGLEEQLDKDIAEAVKDLPVYHEMSRIRGIGPMLAAKVLAMVDIERDDTVSDLWRYSGYGLSNYWVDGDGKIVAPQTGYQWVKVGDEQAEIVRVTPSPKPDWRLEGLRDRPVEGFVLAYNKRLKTTLFLVATSFLRSGSPYRCIYDSAKERYAETRPDWTKAHIHQAAMRKMIKIFLSHLWERWRILEGLPTRAAYVHEQLEHESIYTPAEFGWQQEQTQ